MSRFAAHSASLFVDFAGTAGINILFLLLATAAAIVGFGFAFFMLALRSALNEFAVEKFQSR